ncbi:M20/M25/M40 family metallo-hydrolase [Aquamicrobium sp. LC103]|uniref:M20/M25/M40 family metallo-hydrolase n=1 Tax=Aquamicrobium sp. LC103 TaxID=1120658 RepID=UPI00063E7369|nr:M20/M25/M40 family metallo-hydrolase [Aquamicrobium sp. LC103]TKT82434.1 M20 family peptidase [Aquamicrobium sp. LC103]
MKDSTPIGQTASVDELCRWLQCESPSTAVDGVNRMMDLVVEKVRGTSISIERLPGHSGAGDIVILRSRPEDETRNAPILLLSHLDTVHQVGSVRTSMPIVQRDDRLFGPGVSDMKGGAYLGLTAMLEVVRRETARRPITYVFTSDEEIGSPTSRPVIEKEAAKAAFALVTEAARPDGSIVTARCGVGRFKVGITGTAAHAGRWEDCGQSAISEAARQIVAIDAMSDHSQGVKLTIGTIGGGSAENVIPANAEFSIDLRFADAAKGAAIAAQLKALRSEHAGISISVAGGINRPGYARTEAIDTLFGHAHALAAEIGFELRQAPIAGGASDANFTAALGIPTLDGLGIVGGGGHTAQEYGLISSLKPRGMLLERLLETL